jgi:hypothetical protein
MVTMAATTAIERWTKLVTSAALAFESRFTMLAVKRVDPDLAEALHDQRNLFVEACVTGDTVEIAEQGAALVRGYAVVTGRLEHDQPDDAYMIGQDPATGTMIAIGQQKAAAQRLRETHGDNVILITPDEVAILFARIEELKMIGTVRRKFPGSEIVDSKTGAT